MRTCRRRAPPALICLVLVLSLSFEFAASETKLYVGPPDGNNDQDWVTASSCTDVDNPCDPTSSTLNIASPTAVYFVAGEYPEKNIKIVIEGTEDSWAGMEPSLTIGVYYKPEMGASRQEVSGMQLTVLASSASYTSSYGSVSILGDGANVTSFHSASFTISRVQRLSLANIQLNDSSIALSNVNELSVEAVSWDFSRLLPTQNGMTRSPITISLDNADIGPTTDVSIGLENSTLTCHFTAEDPLALFKNCTSVIEFIDLPYDGTSPRPSIRLQTGLRSSQPVWIDDFSTFTSVLLKGPSIAPTSKWNQIISYDLNHLNFVQGSHAVSQALSTWSAPIPIFVLQDAEYATSDIPPSSFFNCTHCGVSLQIADRVTPLFGVATGTGPFASSITALSSRISGASIDVIGAVASLNLIECVVEDCYVSVSEAAALKLRNTNFFTSDTLTNLPPPPGYLAFLQTFQQRNIELESCAFMDDPRNAGPPLGTVTTPNVLFIASSLNPSTSKTWQQFNQQIPRLYATRLAIGMSSNARPTAPSFVFSGWLSVQQRVDCYLGDSNITSYYHYSAVAPVTGSFSIRGSSCILGFSDDLPQDTSSPSTTAMGTLLTADGSTLFDSVRILQLTNLHYRLKNASSLTGMFFNYNGNDTIFVPNPHQESTLSSFVPRVGISWSDTASDPSLWLSQDQLFPLYTYSQTTVSDPVPIINPELMDTRFSVLIEYRSANTISGQGMYFKLIPPRSCPEPRPQPSESFTCLNGVWSWSGGSNTSFVVVSNPVIINHDLNATTITFHGLNATIDVRGCVILPQVVYVHLTPAELQLLLKTKGFTRPLIYSQCNNTNGQSVPIQVITNGTRTRRSCEELEGRLVSKDGTISGTFKVTASACNRWWIILVSVVGAVLLILIVLILVFTLVPSARRCIRPYTARDDLRKDDDARLQ